MPPTSLEELITTTSAAIIASSQLQGITRHMAIIDLLSETANEIENTTGQPELVIKLHVIASFLRDYAK
jgi:hypothetical protein